MFSENRASRAVRFFENLKHTKGKFHGKPFLLMDWQKEIVRNVYGTLGEDGFRQYRVVYLEIPKKNGKTETVAGAALFHTFADGEMNGEVYSCAAEKGQASIAFDVAVDMVDQSPALKKRAKLNLSQKMITDKGSGSFYKAISAEAYSKHGLNVSACIFDELHAQPSRDLWDVMTAFSGDARTQPIWWVITTAGDDPDRVSVCWEQHEKALKIINGDVTDKTWYPVIYSYDGDDIYNEESWSKANPSLGETIDIEKVREAAEKAKQSEADRKLFRWLRLNQWLTTKLTTWLPLDLFHSTNGVWTREDLKGKECYAGLDLSSTTDLSAFCLVFPPQTGVPDWRVLWECWIPSVNMQDRIRRDKVPYDVWAEHGWITPTEGDVIDYTKIESAIVQASRDYFIKELVSDPAMATMLLQRLGDAGIDCIPLQQTFANLTAPMNSLETLLRKGDMTHEPSPVAAWCFGNTAIAQNGQGYIKFVKESKGRSVIRTKRIDLIAAWVNAMARASLHEVELYETRGLLTL